MNVTGIGRWDWLIGSVMVATLASLSHWLVDYLAGTGGSGKATGPWLRAQRVIESPWFRYPVRLVYAVGIPAAALVWQGALSTRGLGLQVLDPGILTLSGGDPQALGGSRGQIWGEGLNWLVVVAALSGLIISAGLLLARRLASQQPDPETTSRRSLGVACLEAVYHQVHWAFYREPFVFRWGIGVGSWLGALPVLLETAVSLIFWERLRTQGAAYQRKILVRAGLFVAGTQLYLLTQNLWLAIAMDALVGWVTTRWSNPAGFGDQSVTSEAMTTIR